MVEKFGGGEGRQLADWMVRQRYGSLYRAYSFPLDAINNLASVWAYIKSTSVERPVRTDKILERLTYARFDRKPLNLFSPWGPRYKSPSPKIQQSDPEITTLREMKTVLDEFESRNMRTNVMIMPADVYGIEINGLSADFVHDYFSYLGDVARRELGGKINFIPWSWIRNVNLEQYKQALLNFGEDFEREVEKTLTVAGRFNPENAMSSARKYVAERMAEAAIIESAYTPIKLSLVRKGKDSVDGPLPRIYLVKNRAPWLAGG